VFVPPKVKEGRREEEKVRKEETEASKEKGGAT
jgi:hypothetical protein